MPGLRLRPLQDEKGYYLTVLSLSSDARATCFEPAERFYSCPVAIAGDEFANAAYEWHSCFSKPGRRDFLPRKVAGHVKEAVFAVDAALAKRDLYEANKMPVKK